MKKFNLTCSIFLTIFLTFFEIFFTKSLAGNINPDNESNINEISNLNDDFLNDKEIYILGPGDIVKIFEKDTNTSLDNLTILNDGSITFPLVESANISGMSLKEAKIYLTNILREELINPELEIMLIKPRRLKFSVIGEVNQPGFYTQKTDEFSPTIMTVVDAIQIAGGVTTEANLSKVSIIRKLPKSSDSLYKKADLNLAKLIKFGELEQNPNIFDGDVIEVFKADNNSDLEITNSNLSPAFIKVHVIGEVEKPGEITLGNNTPLSKAILSAGGFKNGRYSAKNIELVRITKNGTLSRKNYNLDFSKKISRNSNPLLNQGDVIRVRRNIIASSSDTLNTVTSPLTGIVNSIYLFKILND